jgi:hypothetical protein
MNNQKIVEAIKDRKQQFVKAFPQLNENRAMDSMYFNHICTVLDHASMIMNHTVSDMVSGSELEQEIKSAEIDKKMREIL